MHDINLLKENIDAYKQRLLTRRCDVDLDALLRLDEKRRLLIQEIDDLSHERNQANTNVVQAKKENGNADSLIKKLKEISNKISDLKQQLHSSQKEFEFQLLRIPNIPSEDVPIGDGPEENVIVEEKGVILEFAYKPKDHIELVEALDLVDFQAGVKTTGKSFVSFKGAGAKLERALIQFMLDLHTEKHGYTEVSPPFLVRRSSLEGTGQLPKFEDDLYRIFRGSKEKEQELGQADDLFLIPTAEVPVTNIHRDAIHKGELPIAYTAYTPCFRLEAGSYGKETRGMIRVHQFDKVELVRFCYPEDSEKEHQKLLEHAKRIFDELKIPYRVLLLSSGDMGFAATKCYDIEVWAPGTGQWLEASSCSNFLDFQARRAGIKFKRSADKKARYMHTLNGSGVALARTFISLIENYQNEDGSITIPDVLKPYMRGLEVIR